MVNYFKVLSLSVCVFLYSGIAYSGVYDGLWFGTTDKGNDLIFKVSDDAVTSFVVITQYGSSSSSSYPGYSISDNSFVIPDKYSGTFLNNTVCNGTWRSQDGSQGDWSASKAGACNDIDKSDWIQISGNITYNGEPLCAMVLANGQHMFTCDPIGKYSLTVPADSNGQITLFGFCDGLMTFKTILKEWETDFDIEMSACP